MAGPGARRIDNLTRHNCQPYRVGLDTISTLRYVAPSEATAMALAHYPP